MPRFLKSALLSWIAAAMLAASLQVHADDLSAADARQIRAVIEAQLAAFAADDAARALSYAAPDIRRRYAEPERFLKMVREHYPVVYRHASVGFLPPEIEDDEVFQAVEMSDADGVLWVAIYRMGRLEDGHWRIMGCRVVSGEGQAI
ncbi:MAG TPA: DUF4864 domain-containing protein [Methyloversatilis sp.]